MFKKGLLILTALLMTGSVFAHGKGDIDKRDVAQMDSWQEDIEVGKKKEGTYNVLVTVEDKGGNKTVGGPYNIFIDKDSDFPVSGITNPIRNMRVPGNLNIVGTCIDDDGVDAVYLSIFKGTKDEKNKPVVTITTKDGKEVELRDVLVTGKEFWEYKLDTTSMEEGPYTIEVYGDDIHGHSSKTKNHKKGVVTFNLDRRLPVTQVTNMELGKLVSGKITLKGNVTDGNGIKNLQYSLDGQQNFFDLKFKEDKKTGICTFELPVNTKDFKDGAAVCWFRSVDKMGSVGLNSFLYFIDNTKPDVKIVSPAEGEVKNGVFGVVGYAKDVIGIQSLKWTCSNGKSGEFTLTPGNPYWYQEIDTAGMTKNVEFTVTAIDTVNNEVVKKITIPLDQEADKPVVTIEYPAADQVVEGDAGTVFLRGIASDDDGVASIEYKLDGGEVKTLETHGVFYSLMSEEADLPAGKHSVTVTAVDKFGVKGNPVTHSFISKGKIPVFAEAKAGGKPVFSGITVHPEANPSYETSVSSAAGISSVAWKVEWGKEGIKTGESTVKPGDKTVNVSIPLNNSEIAWGAVKITVTAADIYNRVVEKSDVVKIQDITDIAVEAPKVVIDDSRVSESGDIINDVNHPVSGYFAGGKIKSASIVPATPFAAITFNENTFTLTATDNPDVVGASAPVKVRVVSTDNIPYESQELIFHSDSPAPEVAVDSPIEVVLSVPVEQKDEEGNVIPAPKESVTVNGKVASKAGLTSIGYRIASFGLTYDQKTKNLVTGAAASAKFGELTAIPAKTGSFSFEIPSENLGPGMHIVEIVANNGKTAAGAVFIKKLPALPETDAAGKKITGPKGTYYGWADGVDVYGAIICQNDAAEGFSKVEYRRDMKPGETAVSFKDKTGKAVSTYKASKPGAAKVFITSVGGIAYASGMHVVIPYGAKDAVKAVVTVESQAALKAINWTVEGESVPGGDVKTSGKITDPKLIRSPAAGVYEADISLGNLPVRFTTLKVTAETAEGNADYKGTIAVIRERDSSLIDNDRRIYWAPAGDALYDTASDRYVIKTGDRFNAFANVYAPVNVSFVSAQPGLTVTADGNNIYVIAEKEGTYKNVAVKVTDAQGVSYTSSAVSFLVDDALPAVSIEAPAARKWIQKTTSLSVKASDTNGIASVEFSLDGGQTWNPAAAAGSGSYTAVINAGEMDDGLVSVDIRAKDNAGKYGYTQTVIQKDTTPPDPLVIVPCPEDIVNGENEIVFAVKDNGYFAKAEYVAPKTGKETPAAVEVPFTSMVETHVGTKEKPIDEKMSFIFTDEAGNTTTYRVWDFIVDNKSDLPVAEVHLPDEEAVITTAFQISGITIDDDGPTKIWYKLDDGEYKPASEDYASSFKIDIDKVSFTKLGDNEHKVTVYAEDLNGVKGPEFVRNFKISLEEPQGAVETPPITETVKGWVKLTGRATDKNGIRAVYVSVDNGNTYNESVGNFSHENQTANWSYEFDTRVVQDGTHVVFLKIVDWFGIEGIFSTQINIDNTAPSIDLELPLDDSKTTKMLFFSGQTTDNIGLEKLYITIRSLEGKTVSSRLSRIDLVPGEIITQSIDLSSLDNGFYNVELTGHDAADNITRVSRNIQLNKNAVLTKVDLLYPLNGEAVQGRFNIYGTAVSDINIEKLELLVDGTAVAETTLSASGYYKFDINPNDKNAPVILENGDHKIQVKAHLANVHTIVSGEQTIKYRADGPWVTIDNFTYGDFAIERPYIAGKAGYSVTAEEVAAAKAKGASKETKAALEAKSVEKVEISFNNGKTFQEVSQSGKWRYRIENEDIAEGYHFLLVRAIMKNGERAVTRVIVQVDKTKPTVKLISPGEGGSYNESIEFSGLAHDNVALKNVTLLLRKGDKSSYEVPAFIQGLYLDGQFWGASLYSFGAGLSFFDDNVRLQAQWGQFTQQQRNIFSRTTSRYGGDIYGGKILANVAYIPFMYFFGRDYEWLSANCTVGANFSRFTETGSGKPQILSALLAQLEFPRISFAKQKMFRTVAVYTEGQLWFIPTDVQSTVDIASIVPQISIGLRVNVF